MAVTDPVLALLISSVALGVPLVALATSSVAVVALQSLGGPGCPCSHPGGPSGAGDWPQGGPDQALGDPRCALVPLVAPMSLSLVVTLVALVALASPLLVPALATSVVVPTVALWCPVKVAVPAVALAGSLVALGIPWLFSW